MPYKIQKKNNKYIVVAKDSGDIKGTHDTRAKALAQLKALYANVEDVGGSEAHP